MKKNEFDYWITMNYNSIIKTLSVQNRFDEDCIQEAYLRSVQSISETPYDKYLLLFMTNYKIVAAQKYSYSRILCHPNPLFFTFLSEMNDIDEKSQKKSLPSLNRIKKFVRTNYSQEVVSIFCLYVKGMSYKAIADYIGCSNGTVKKRIEQIKKRVKYSMV